MGRKVKCKDSLGYKYPKIAKMIAIKENKMEFNDTYKIGKCSGKSFYFKCNECGAVSTNKKSISNIINQGFSCEFCSDNIPLTEKFMCNILKQLNIDFIKEYSKLNCEWCGDYRYDIYIKDFNMIIELQGLQHYKQMNLGKLADIQINDFKKLKNAKGKVDKYITIDMRFSKFDYLKNNIIYSLNDVIDLSKVNFEKAWEESQKSLCIKTWDLWNNFDYYTSKDIANILNLSKQCVIKYLKRGKKINKCNYSKEEAYKRSSLKRKGKNNNMAISVICLTTKKIFTNITEASKYYDVCLSSIGRCCKNKQRYTRSKYGKLTWKYLNWKHNKTYRIKK